jgi:hypothetical protein
MDSGRFVSVLIASVSVVFVCAQNSTFSPDRLTGFYNDFLLEEKQKLADANLTSYFSFWVSTNGNDSSSGTRQDPFLTLQRARDAVRALPSSAFKDQDIYIFIENGTYRLTQPLMLDASDSGEHGHNVIYSAAPGASPIISGAVQVTNWNLYDATLGIYRAKIGPYTSRQLYINSNRAMRAQTTPYPPGFLPKWSNGGIEFIQTTLNPPAWNDPSTWTNPQDIEAIIVTQWKMMRVPLNSITPGLITMQQPAWNNANVYFDITTNAPGEWSFWQVTRFENAYEFLTEPGQWYLDSVENYLYYIPLPGEDLNTADVELPILETLIVGQGTLGQPIHNIRFEGLTFSYATWLGPSGNNGYVSDQSGQILIGSDHSPNFIGHDQNVVPTPGNLSFTFANQITFYGNIFQHLGAVGLQFGFGSKNNTINSNLFTDISSSAIELGGATATDSHPSNLEYTLSNNLITNNLISAVANEFVDAAGIFVGFTQYTTIIHNTIIDVPWSGIAMGWGWGLLDVGSFPGLGNAYSGEWGTFTTPTPNVGCKILQNNFQNFLNVLWDGGAIYTTGQQGPSASEGLLIQGNIASAKCPAPCTAGGGNVFYSDGGSRYILLQSNASYGNPIGVSFYGPPPNPLDPFYSQYPFYYLQNGAPYGSDSGGCRTYGDINYSGNYWLQVPLPTEIDAYNNLYHTLVGFYPYISEGFDAVCPYTSNGISYPINLSYQNNKLISSKADIPAAPLSNSGVQSRPPTIPPNLWIIPPP